MHDSIIAYFALGLLNAHCDKKKKPAKSAITTQNQIRMVRILALARRRCSSGVCPGLSVAAMHALHADHHHRARHALERFDGGDGGFDVFFHRAVG